MTYTDKYKSRLPNKYTYVCFYSKANVSPEDKFLKKRIQDLHYIADNFIVVFCTYGLYSPPSPRVFAEGLIEFDDIIVAGFGNGEVLTDGRTRHEGLLDHMFVTNICIALKKTLRYRIFENKVSFGGMIHVEEEKVQEDILRYEIFENLFEGKEYQQIIPDHFCPAEFLNGKLNMTPEDYFEGIMPAERREIVYVIGAPLCGKPFVTNYIGKNWGYRLLNSKNINLLPQLVECANYSICVNAGWQNISSYGLDMRVFVIEEPDIDPLWQREIFKYVALMKRYLQLEAGKAVKYHHDDVDKYFDYRELPEHAIRIGYFPVEFYRDEDNQDKYCLYYRAK